jgi:hypothetical protein
MPEARAAEHGKLRDTVVALGIGIFVSAFRSWWRTSHRNVAADSLESANAEPEQHVVQPGPPVATSSEAGGEEQPAHGGTVTLTWDEPLGRHVDVVPGTASTVELREPTWLSKVVEPWLSKVFELNPAGLNWPRGVMFIDVILVPLVVFWAIGYEQYLLSAVVGALFAGVVDLGGSYQSRAARIAVFAVIGAGITALGFDVGRSYWGWMVIAAFGVTLVAGLALRLGVHSFVAATLLNVWFILALSLGFGFHQHAHITTYIWAQVCAWVGGSALWIVLTFIAWLVHGREDVPPPVPELPGDTSPRKLTAPMIMFAVIRAIAIGGSVAIAFGFDLSHGLWIPIAALVAMKPSLEQTTVQGGQRIAGALIGAGAAVLLLLIPANEHGFRLFQIDHGLQLVALILLMHAIAARFFNYGLYYACITAAVLILADISQPSNYGAEGDRVLWALCGVGIGVFVMFLAGLLAKRRANAPPQPASQPA